MGLNLNILSGKEEKLYGVEIRGPGDCWKLRLRERKISQLGPSLNACLPVFPLFFQLDLKTCFLT